MSPKKELDSPHHLYDLCADKKWDQVRAYLDRSDISNDIKKQQICWKNHGDGGTTFCLACYVKAPLDIIKSMIDIAGDEIIHFATINNYTPLHQACYEGVDTEIMKLLVERGKKKLVFEKGSDSNFTALHAACNNDIIDVGDIKPMVDIGGKELVLETRNQIQYTCLHFACCHKPTSDALKLLLEVGGKDVLMSRNQYGRTPFHVALLNTENHGPQGLRMFVEAGDMELFVANDNEGRTPISLIKGLESSNRYKSLEWKDFFSYFHEKLSQEVFKVREVIGLEDENEKTTNTKKMEDKTRSDTKIIESLEAKLNKLEKEKEEEKIDHEKAIQVLQTENLEAKLKSDAKLIEALQVEHEKAKESLQSLQAQKESDAELIQTLQTKKDEIRIEKQGIMMELKACISSEHEKDKIIESLVSETSNQREDITNMQLKLDEAEKQMNIMKRKIEEIETVSKEKSNQGKPKRSRFSFW